MKTSEFIKKVEELDCKVLDKDLYFKIVCVENKTLSTISKGKLCSIGSNWVAFDKKEDDFKEKLFCLMAEYTSTPIEEREEEKKYYIRPKGMDVGDNVWNYYGLIGKWDINDVVKDNYRMTEFTRKEIKELTGQELEHYSYCEVGADTWIG